MRVYRFMSTRDWDGFCSNFRIMYAHGEYKRLFGANKTLDAAKVKKEFKEILVKEIPASVNVYKGVSAESLEGKGLMNERTTDRGAVTNNNPLLPVTSDVADLVRRGEDSVMKVIRNSDYLFCFEVPDGLLWTPTTKFCSREEHELLFVDTGCMILAYCTHVADMQAIGGNVLSVFNPDKSLNPGAAGVSIFNEAFFMQRVFGL